MGHDHAHGTGAAHRGRLALVLALSVGVLVVEAVVAWLTGSLALLADAGHMLGDSFGIVMALAAITVAQRGGGPGSRRTFGYSRTEVLAAGANGLILLGLAAWVTYSAIRRFGDSPELEGGLILVAGGVGLVLTLDVSGGTAREELVSTERVSAAVARAAGTVPLGAPYR